MVVRLFRFLEGSFSGSILNFGGIGYGLPPHRCNRHKWVGLVWNFHVILVLTIASWVGGIYKFPTRWAPTSYKWSEITPINGQKQMGLPGVITIHCHFIAWRSGLPRCPCHERTKSPVAKIPLRWLSCTSLARSTFKDVPGNRNILIEKPSFMNILVILLKNHLVWKPGGL